ncbi:glutamyl-tRNA(Gln) amidotransferase subunit A [Rhizoctonia solani AG-1 IA]|uniref:Glutamyl-tRNA(Gln) amidotransferase subunit A n=1 Tax=Thanatephorus cucumeris (strain AG1-IA) TaxID=983506 RepID=L8WX04_THACA|nr:glutamyl-tRNA(Gln) amidotransferase subunit A [Rhizoctonia solani AG-1 IA]
MKEVGIFPMFNPFGILSHHGQKRADLQQTSRNPPALPVLSALHYAASIGLLPDYYPNFVTLFKRCYPSIVELQYGLERCQFSIAQAYLARIEEVNLKGPKLRAVIEINPKAIQQAASLDNERKKGRKRSPLHGIPILLKDNIASEGMNNTAGSYALLGSTFPGDATVADKLRKAGAIILGKANLSEWMHFRDLFIAQGWSARGGQGTNPYYPGADPCGSSSGSAVATAIGLATASLGTETVGSLICPSSYNNVVGIKPTVGLAYQFGIVIPVSSRQDTIGPIARNVADAAAILTVIAGRDKKDNYTQTAPKKTLDYTQFLNRAAIKGKRFGVPRDIFTNDAVTGNNPAINAEFVKALDTIRSLGGIVVDPVESSLGSSFDSLQNSMASVLAVDFKIEINKYLNSLKSIPTGVTSLAKLIAFNDACKELEQPSGYEGQNIFLASNMTSGYDSAYYDALRTNLAQTREQGIDAMLKSYKLDALVVPSNAAIAGYPMITDGLHSVPLGFHPNDTTVVPSSAGPNTVFPAPGVPFGLSFVGTAYSEPSLIGFAYAYEQRTQTRLKRRAYTQAVPTTQLEDIIR